ncbi:MAG: SH3 domain-containing protein [Beijerinckiaceae bacterium]
MQASAPRRNIRAFLVTAMVAMMWPAAGGAAPATPKGPVSGLPIPRYVSLKSDRVNLREGPSKEHRTAWVFQRAGLPVEIVAEFDNWRRIRDAEGSEGWVLHSLLSGRRTAIVAPWRKGETHDLKDSPAAGAAIVAHLESGVVVSVRRCDQRVCRVTGRGFDGYIAQTLLWGVYSDEKID